MLAHARGGEMTSRRPVTDLPGMYRELIRLGSVWQPSRTLAMARACAGQASQALAAAMTCPAGGRSLGLRGRHSSRTRSVTSVIHNPREVYPSAQAEVSV